MKYISNFQEIEKKIHARPSVTWLAKNRQAIQKKFVTEAVLQHNAIGILEIKKYHFKKNQFQPSSFMQNYNSLFINTLTSFF